MSALRRGYGGRRGAGARSLSGAPFSFGGFVLPRWLRRPVRLLARLGAGDLQAPPFAATALSAAFLASSLAYGGYVGGNLDGFVKGMTGVKSLGQWISGQFDTTLNWNDVAWIRSLWPGKLIIKGVLDVGDARAAAATGADAIVVSNHGGRQLDGAPSSISALPRIVDAVGSDTEILFDGGVRSGQDVLRALALGARACMIGRAFLYGLGAGGEAGVAKTIDIIAKELSVSMALTGRRTIAEIDDTVIDRG